MYLCLIIGPTENEVNASTHSRAVVITKLIDLNFPKYEKMTGGEESSLRKLMRILQATTYFLATEEKIGDLG